MRRKDSEIIDMDEILEIITKCDVWTFNFPDKMLQATSLFPFYLAFYSFYDLQKY